MKIKASKTSIIIAAVILLAIACLLAWNFPISPIKRYDWLMGMVHGALVVPNLIFDVFKKVWFYRAPLRTSMYDVTWWIFIGLNVLYYLGLIWTIIKKK